MRVTEVFVRPIGAKAFLTIHVEGTDAGNASLDVPLLTGDVLAVAHAFEDATIWLRKLAPAPAEPEAA